MVGKRGSKGSKQKQRGGTSARVREHNATVASYGYPQFSLPERKSGSGDTRSFLIFIAFFIGGIIALIWWRVSVYYKEKRALEKVLDPNAKTTEEERHDAAGAMMYGYGGYY